MRFIPIAFGIFDSSEKTRANPKTLKKRILLRHYKPLYLIDITCWIGKKNRAVTFVNVRPAIEEV